jgi:hypothetical protein
VQRDDKNDYDFDDEPEESPKIIAENKSNKSIDR